MIENLIVLLILAGAITYTVWSFKKKVSAKQSGCGCGNAKNCASANVCGQEHREDGQDPTLK